jgi:hypothetical protein
VSDEPVVAGAGRAVVAARAKLPVLTLENQIDSFREIFRPIAFAGPGLLYSVK